MRLAYCRTSALRDAAMTQPLVSILIPAYNAERWIGDALASAANQTWPKLEIIVVDDGSTDRTLEIANRFASKQVRVESQAHQGVSVARNAAYARCQGDYIQWLDADDLLERDKIEVQAREINGSLSKRTLLSGAWGQFSYRKQKARFTPTALWSDLAPVEWMIRKMNDNLHMQPDNWLVSRELCDAAGPWDPRLWRDNDGEYFSRVIAASDGIRFVPNARSYYRRVGFTSISYIGGSNVKLESLFLSMKLHIQYLRSMEESERTRAACVRYIQDWLPEFYPTRLDLAGELKELLEELGGMAQDPVLSWKYHWIVGTFGWGAGRSTQQTLRRLKASSIFAWDRVMHRLEGRDGRK